MSDWFLLGILVSSATTLGSFAAGFALGWIRRGATNRGSDARVIAETSRQQDAPDECARGVSGPQARPLKVQTATGLSELGSSSVGRQPRGSVRGPSATSGPVKAGRATEADDPEKSSSLSIPTAWTPSALKSPTVVSRTGPKSPTGPLVDPYLIADRMWTEEEVERLVSAYGEGNSVFAIARIMGIDQFQVVRELIAQKFGYRSAGIDEPLGDASRHRARYSEAELDQLRSFIEAGVGIDSIAKSLNRSVQGVGWRALDRRFLPARD